MNKRIQELAKQADDGYTGDNRDDMGHALVGEDAIEKFAELIVKECRNVLTDVYRETPLELCGPLLTADEKIAEHFYGVEE